MPRPTNRYSQQLEAPQVATYYYTLQRNHPLRDPNVQGSLLGLCKLLFSPFDRTAEIHIPTILTVKDRHNLAINLP